MNVTVIGAGAMGSLFAAYLANGGMQVTLVERHRDIVDRIRRDGVNVDGVRGRLNMRLPIVTDADEAPPAELVLLFVKAYDTAAAMDEHGPALSNGGAVLTMQNGIGNVELIAQKLGPERVLAGTTTLGANLIEPGVIRHAGEGATAIGEIGGDESMRAAHIAEAFSAAGIVTDTVANINELLWNKLCVNAAINPLTALLRVRNGVLAEHEQTRHIMRQAVAEVVAVAATQGLPLDAEALYERALNVARQTADNRSSMLADILGGKRTEIDFINGAVARLGREAKVPTPTNEMLTELIQTLEVKNRTDQQPE